MLLDMPKLTIITINRNNAEGLRKTMESVFEQTFSDFEYIIVDGASTDDSLQAINSQLAVVGIDFKWISESDSGVYQAMNKGITIANGEYLLFLNSGDFLISKNVLASVFSKVINADIICGRCNVSENGKVIWTSTPPNIVTFGTLYTVGLAHQSTFIKRNLFDNLGLYREDFKYNSDIDFWYRSIILNGATTEKLDLIISDYNLEGISSLDHKTKQYKEEISTILNQANFDKFIPDYEAWKAERTELEILYWVKSKKLLYGLLSILYSFAKIIAGFKSRHS